MGIVVPLKPPSSSMTSRHSSETAEHFTPNFVVEAARATLGRIDLDPASTREANARIKAKRCFTREEDGFTMAWRGTVFLNPPGGRSDNQQRPVKVKCRETGACGLPPGHTHYEVESSQKKWWFKLAREFRDGRTTAGVFVCFSVELLQSTQVDTPQVQARWPSGAGERLPVPLDFPICFPSRRVSYLRSDGKVGSQPPHASALVCVAHDGFFRQRFKKAFEKIGYVTRGGRL